MSSEHVVAMGVSSISRAIDMHRRCSQNMSYSTGMQISYWLREMAEEGESWEQKEDVTSALRLQAQLPLSSLHSHSN